MNEKYAFWVTLRTHSDHCCWNKAEIRILDFKTTWSEFQKPSQTAASKAKPSCVYSILKPHGSDFQKPIQTTTEQGKFKVYLFNS